VQRSELESQLQEDAAQQVPPFGAESVRMARRLGSAATDLLLGHIEASRSTAFLALEALREADPGAFGGVPGPQRAEIYANNLQNESVFYNAWGVPGYRLTDTAHALIDLGDEAVAVLEPLLTDRRLAPLSGSQDATTSNMYGNRVCDYAWTLISEIKDRPYAYFQDPAERDPAIEELRQELSNDTRRERGQG
jgi:hypothetical protein